MADDPIGDLDDLIARYQPFCDCCGRPLGTEGRPWTTPGGATRWFCHRCAHHLDVHRRDT